MSLKTFHLIFISFSVLLCWGFGGWCLRAEAARGSMAYTTGGILSIALGFGLAWYEVTFVRRLKNQS